MKLTYPIQLILITLTLIVMGCNTPQQESADSEIVADTSTAEVIDTITVVPLQKEDAFLQAVQNFSTKFPEYNSVSSHLVDTINVYTDHWLLKTVDMMRENLKNTRTKRSLDQLLKLPTPKDYEDIIEIRQGLFYRSYKNSNDVVIEEWKLKDALSAERWLIFLKDSLRSNRYTKPPRFQWVEGDHLYLVSTKSAFQWSQQSDSLIEILSQKTKSQLHSIYHPLNLKHYKKWQGPAHSSTHSNDNTHLFTTKRGPHYAYYYFTKHRLTGAARSNASSEFTPKQEFHIITSLHQPFNGDEQYETIKETLVAIQCAINDSALNSLDIVGKRIDELEQSFGIPLYKKEGQFIFGHSNRVIVVRLDEGIVKAFKYMRLKDAFNILQEDAEILSSILSFNETL